MSWSQNQNDRKPRNKYFVKVEHHYLHSIYTAISNDVTSIIIPLGKHLRFYVINFRKLINVYIFAYPEYRSFS
jgi:hypothetical protein